MNVQGKGILITGASQGLGEGLALELARRGARLALVARGREGLERVVREIRAGGGEAHAIPADIGDKEAIHPLAATAQAILGSVDGRLSPCLKPWSDTTSTFQPGPTRSRIRPIIASASR